VTDDPLALTVVGIGADGWPGLTGTAIAALTSAEVIMGGRRQLDLLPAELGAVRVSWPAPLLPALPGLLEAHRGRRTAVLASGDPMFHGIGATLVRLRGAAAVRIIPHPSSVSLAAARLGWPLTDVDVLSLVSAPVEELHRLVHPHRRILILSAGARTPAAVAALLTARGYGDSTLTVLAELGGPAETMLSGRADAMDLTAVPALNVIAVSCSPGGTGPEASETTRGAGPGPRPLVPGLPDAVYDSDGQLTKREVRAVTLAHLGPQPGELLWDIGAGSGSIAIEWMRTHRDCRAVAVESSAERAARIGRNAAALGVPGLRIVEGRAPGALAGLPAPDVVFIGGGVTGDGVVEAALAALPSGGRLVANAVTLQAEAVLASCYGRLGGELTRIAVNRASPVGGFTGWRAMMPVTIWSVIKP
jgi:precorrin-6Y C5,15-methyltransferase (decarboxylating)